MKRLLDWTALAIILIATAGVFGIGAFTVVQVYYQNPIFTFTIILFAAAYLWASKRTRKD